MDERDARDAYLERMRTGVRAGLLTRLKSGLKLTPGALTGLLCASAIMPVLTADGTVGVAIASAEVLGSIGAGLLTNEVNRIVERMRERGDEPSGDRVEGELARRIESAVVDENDGEQRALRAEAAAVLRRVGAVEIALQVAMEADLRVRDELVTALVRLGGDVSEFRFVLTDVLAAVGTIQEMLRMQDIERRADRDRARERTVQLQMLREELTVIERRTRPAGGADGGVPAPTWEGCPYRGLWPFEEGHAGIFYGREQVTAELVASLAERLTGVGMLVVTGASGVGKSSLLRAGLLPALARGSLPPGSRTWPRVVMTPTASPLDELAAHLAALSGADAATLRRTLAEEPTLAHLAVRQAVLAAAGPPPAGGTAPRLVIVVDQLEEIFTLDGEDHAAAGQVRAFLTVLHTIGCSPVGPAGEPAALVVLGIRGDFLDRCAGDPHLGPALRAGPFIVGPMERAEMRRAIVGPAAAGGLAIEPGLVETVLDDLSGAGSALPLLSQTAMLIWEHREGDQLTSRGYGRVGGVARAVQTSAENVYRGLSPEQQEMTRAVFLRLTVVARDGQLARRRSTWEDLSVAAPAGRDTDVRPVLDAFAAERLVIFNEGTAEIAHDVLLTAWPRLRAWLDGDRADRALYSQLLDDAAVWRENERAASYLYRSARLSAVRQAISRWQEDAERYPALAVSEVEFLAASERAANRTSRIRRAVVSILIVLALVAGTGALAAVKYAAEANRQHAVALSRQLTAQSMVVDESDPAAARRLAVAAWQVAPTPEARQTIVTLLAEQRGILVGHSGAVYALAFRPGGGMLATAGADGTILRWDPLTGHPIGTPIKTGSGAVYALAFSADGGMLATAGADGTVKRWNPQTGDPIGAPLIGHTDTVYALAFSPDGRTLASASDDHSVRLWDPVTGVPRGLPMNGHTGAVYALAFSPDSKVLASAGADGTTRRWTVSDGQPLGTPLRGDIGTVNALAFSPDGHTLVAAGVNGTVLRWSLSATAPALEPPLLAGSAVYAVAFSPDGHMLDTGGEDGTIQRWDPRSGQPVGTSLTGHGGPVRALAFSPDGRMFASGSTDATARLWDPATGRSVAAALVGHSGTVNAAEFSPDGRMLATASTDATVRRWDAVTGHPMEPLAGNSGAPLYALAFSPDGKILAAAGADGTILRWDPVTGHPIGTPMNTSSGAVYALAFGADGKVLASAGDDGKIRRWTPLTGQPIGAPLTGHKGTVYALAFSPDGRILASAGADTEVRRWNPLTGQPIGAPLTGHTDWILSLAFSPDGRMLASAGSDRTIRRWDAVSGAPIGAALDGGGGTVNALAFSRDGTMLITAGFDGVLRFWRPRTGAPIGAQLTGHSGTVYALAFSPADGIVASAGSDRTVRLWDPSLYLDPVASICARIGAPTQDEWNRYAPGEPLPKVCA